MTDTGSRRRCECIVCTTDAAVTLLETGRPAMALALLRDLPDRIGWEVQGTDADRCTALPPIEDVMRQAVPQKAEPRRTAQRDRSPPPAGGRPAFRRLAAELARHIGRLGVDRAAEVLGVRLVDLQPLFAGTVEASRTALAKLRKAADDHLEF